MIGRVCGVEEVAMTAEPGARVRSWPGRIARSIVVFLAIAAGLSSARAAVEPWADPALPVKGDLILWLDAGRQAAAQASHGFPPAISGSMIGTVFDGSGSRHHLGQRRGEAQPRIITLAGRSAFRFDGKDDCLERAGLGLELEGVTIFLVAAPASNPGGFRGFLAGNQAGVNDYASGFTVDLGPTASPRFQTLNVEGKGFNGAVNVFTRPADFGEFHLLEVVIPPGPGSITTILDDVQQTPRMRQASTLALDELTLGARCYSNEPRPVYLQGFLHGDIAEVLIYGRALGESRRRDVAAYLKAKHRGLSELFKADAARSGVRALRTVAHPPAIQMFVPGFTVKELPLALSNINNVRYRPDGKLVALAYNGNVYLLTDRDGDGLEDHAELFWDNKGRLRAPIGMALTPPGYDLGQGLAVASKGKCSLIIDTDGDDRADREVIVAQGWPELPHGVDALGVAFGPGNDIYFGLGAADFTNPYLLDGQARAHYDLTNERGTIIRVSPGFRSREVVATGIRFPVGLAFNRHGELFATDQEGATWLPNGNPFDELLHIQKGRHYGFPPRHSRYLPGVIDEPSTFDYAPQHQSTCGLFFNQSVEGGPVFGPSWWAWNALVCGYSRGKIFRTELTSEGDSRYVARTALIGVVGMLPVDSCVSEDGALVVAAHSGAPDWGSGPDGAGKIYKVFYSDPRHPQPVMAWSSGPREMRIAFDRPLDPVHLRDLARKATIEFGAAVAAGDRFETLRPGYAAVAAQLNQPRNFLAIRGASVTPDRRSIILATDEQTEPVSYAVTLPSPGRPDRPDSKQKELAQVPEMDLACSLSGVEAHWISASGDASWSGWLPHLSLQVAREFTAQSAEHDTLWSRIRQPGALTLRAQLQLSSMLRPSVQPGSVVDDRLPPEKVTLVFETRGDLRIASPQGKSETTRNSWRTRVSLPIQTPPRDPVPIELALSTGPQTTLIVSFHTDEDPRLRALSLSRILIPWARPLSQPSVQQPRVIPAALGGGHWRRGRDVFQSSEAQCVKCHTVRGEGGKIGPDLSNLVERDYDSVLRDITEPSAAIHPDYVTYSIALASGRVLSGPVRNEGNRLRIGNDKGEEIVVPRTEVEEMKPQAVSIMPQGLTKVLGPERMRDLLTFLLTAPPAPAPIHRDDAPPPRKAAEVDAVLKAGASPAEPAPPDRPLRIVLVSGAKDHGIDEHDYPLWLERWSSLLGWAEGITVANATDWPDPAELARADVMVWYSANVQWTAEKARELDAFLARGGGLVVLHYALNGNRAPEELAQRIGLAWIGGRSKFRHGPLDLGFRTSPTHPIVAGFDRLHLVDESYWNLTGDRSRVNVIATGDEEGERQPLLWTREHGKGRVFCSAPGHYTWTFDDPLFRVLILRGICWTARQRVDRLSALATLGARVDGGAK
jgi:putative heme-binding domain-containing protein